MFHSTSKSLLAYLSWLEVIQCPLVDELWHPLLWNLPITQSHTLFQPDKNNLLRFANSWQGHRNSAWHQLLRAHNSPSPIWDRPLKLIWDYNLYSLRTVYGFFNVPKKMYVQGLWNRGLWFYRPYPRRTESLTICRQAALLSYLKNLGVGRAGIWTSGLLLSRPALIQLC